MQIVCPACDTRYEVPDARLPPGKRVKCTRCGDGWTPVAAPVELLAPEPAPPAAPVAAVSPPSIFPPPTSPPDPAPAPVNPDRFVRLGWLATVLLLATAILLARTYRGSIEHAWPPSARLYNLF